MSNWDRCKKIFWITRSVISGNYGLNITWQVIKIHVNMWRRTWMHGPSPPGKCISKIGGQTQSVVTNTFWYLFSHWQIFESSFRYFILSTLCHILWQLDNYIIMEISHLKIGGYRMSFGSERNWCSARTISNSTAMHLRGYMYLRTIHLKQIGVEFVSNGGHGGDA